MVCQFDQMLQWDILIAALVSGIDRLLNAQKIGNILLLQIAVLSQVPYPPIHNLTARNIICQNHYNIQQIEVLTFTSKCGILQISINNTF